VTHNFHYFIFKGDLMKHLSDLQAMSGFLACLMHDINHPGVNNQYLIAIKHPKAIRYNDQSVLEFHHLAMAFKILLDPQNDIFELLSEAQYWNVRQIIIKMILSTDLSQHYNTMMTFKGRLSTTKKNFPEDTSEDKQLIMNICLYAADHSHPCKPTIQYFRWMSLQMEEFYQQGDIEKKMGFQVTPFYDRTTCNPFIYQKGYLDVVVEPIYQTLVLFIQDIKDDCLIKGLEENKKMLEQKIDETKNYE